MKLYKMYKFKLPNFVRIWLAPLVVVVIHIEKTEVNFRFKDGSKTVEKEWWYGTNSKKANDKCTMSTWISVQKKMKYLNKLSLAITKKSQSHYDLWWYYSLFRFWNHVCCRYTEKLSQSCHMWNQQIIFGTPQFRIQIKIFWNCTKYIISNYLSLSEFDWPYWLHSHIYWFEI